MLSIRIYSYIKAAVTNGFCAAHSPTTELLKLHGNKALRWNYYLAD